MSARVRREVGQTLRARWPPRSACFQPELSERRADTMAIINGHTSVFGILGDPVRHVRTPQALNALFDERNYNGVLVPIEVSSGEGLAGAVASLKAFPNW